MILVFTGGARIDAEVAKNLAVGLMYRPSMPENDGMLFVFPNRAFQSLWMKNVRFDLDMIFIDGNRVVGILQNVPAFTETLRTLPLFSTSVLEVNAGWARRHGVQLGDAVFAPS